jgi:hypothetical protein
MHTTCGTHTAHQSRSVLCQHLSHGIDKHHALSLVQAVTMTYWGCSQLHLLMTSSQLSGSWHCSCIQTSTQRCVHALQGHEPVVPQ